MNKGKRSTPDYFIFDCETGGFNPKTDGLCELCGVFVDGRTLEIKDTYETILKPYGKEYTAAAEKVHGLTVELLEEHGEIPEQVIAELITLFEKYNEDKKKSGQLILVGHNVTFDIGFLSELFSDFEMNLTNYISNFKTAQGLYPRYLDTVDLAHLNWANKPMNSFKLIECSKEANIELVDAHRAMNDVEATYGLFKLFIEKMKGNSGEGATKKEKVEFSFKY